LIVIKLLSFFFQCRD